MLGTYFAAVACLTGARRCGQPLLDRAREVVVRGGAMRGERALHETRLDLGDLWAVGVLQVGRRVRHPLVI